MAPADQLFVGASLPRTSPRQQPLVGVVRPRPPLEEGVNVTVNIMDSTIHLKPFSPQAYFSESFCDLNFTLCSSLALVCVLAFDDCQSHLSKIHFKTP